MNRNAQAKIRHFTLIELLVVVGIMLVLLGVSVPAFSRIVRGRSVDNASRMVSSQLMLARAEAVSKRRYVAVIMPGHNFSAPDDGNPYCYGSFRTAWVEYDEANDNYTFDGWVEGTSWTFLPLGAVIAYIDYDQTEPSSMKYDESDDIYELRGDENWFTGGKNSKDESGNVEEESGTVMIDGQTQSAEVRAVVFAPNGRCVNKVHITLIEGVVSSGSKAIESANEHNIHVMEVSRLTGQLKYLM